MTDINQILYVENAEYVNLKFELSLIEVHQMNELGADHVSLSTCYIPDTTEQIFIISGFKDLR
jgi:hypothetical protein